MNLLKELAEVIQGRYEVSAEESSEAVNNLISLFETLYLIQQRQLEEGVSFILNNNNF